MSEQVRVWLVKPGRSVVDLAGRVRATGGHTLPWDDPDALRQRGSVVPTFVDAPDPPSVRHPVVDGAGIWTEHRVETKAHPDLRSGVRSYPGGKRTSDEEL